MINMSSWTRQKLKVFLIIMSVTGGYLSMINMFDDPMESA
jgi:hypothetical protein